MKIKAQILWGVFFIDILFILLDVLGLPFVKGSFFKFLLLIIPICLLVLHSFWTLSIKRGIGFILIATTLGLCSEVIGLNSGVLFGGRYVYKSGSFMILHVPFSVIFYWAVFIYTGYCITTSFFYWLHKDKPNRKDHNLYLLPLLLLIDGLIVTAIDLFMDPLSVHAGSWKWLDGGPYFGVPIGNFIGWFIVTVVVTCIVRLYEYFNPQAKKESINKSVFLIPLIGYGAMALSFTDSALEIGMKNLVIIGICVMLPTVIINLFLFMKWRNKKFSVV